MKRVTFAIAGAFIVGAVVISAFQYGWDLALIPVLLFLAASSGFFWVFLLAATLALLALSKRRKLSRWKRALGVFSVLIAAYVATGLRWFLYVEGPLFNLAAPITHEYRVYPVECRGKVVAGNFCCGKLDVPLNATTYSVSVARQQVFETTADITTPLHNCEVRDYLNWVCTTYWDVTGENETDMVHGKCFDKELMNEGTLNVVSSGPCPAESEFLHSLERAIRQDFVYVSPVDWWLGQNFEYWGSHKGIWNEKEWNVYVRSASEPVCQAPQVN